jgi:hypothetical protein
MQDSKHRKALGMAQFGTSISSRCTKTTDRDQANDQAAQVFADILQKGHRAAALGLADMSS